MIITKAVLELSQINVELIKISIKVGENYGKRFKLFSKKVL